MALVGNVRGTLGTNTGTPLDHPDTAPAHVKR